MFFTVTTIKLCSSFYNIQTRTDITNQKSFQGAPTCYPKPKAFRAYLRAFIKDFQPELIREGKRYELYLKKDGKYAVRYKDDNDMPVFLSESEQTLFRYLCFLKSAEFWHKFEMLRNLHAIKKPLLVKDFFSRLDESINIENLLQRTMEIKRQAIILY